MEGRVCNLHRFCGHSGVLITKLLFSFSDVLKATNCTFQEVDNIFCLAVGIAVYDEFFSCMCAAEFVCALDVFARHTSSRINFFTLTIGVLQSY